MTLDTSAIRFIALDLDGTLLRTDKSISDRTRDAIRNAEADGYVPIVATARPPRGAAALLIGFLSEAHTIYYSGALVILDGQTIHTQTIPVDAAYTIVDRFIQRAPHATASLEINDRIYACL